MCTIRMSVTLLRTHIETLPFRLKITKILFVSNCIFFGDIVPQYPNKSFQVLKKNIVKTLQVICNH
jgi:hypothetical protein